MNEKNVIKTAINNYLPKKRGNRSSPSVAIIGGNFAGLKAAVALPENFRVTVIDPWPWFEFSPNIHELISGFKTPEMLRFSKEIAINRPGHKLFSEAATAILPEKQIIITDSGARLNYDYCLIAMGGQSSFGNVEGADLYAMPFKSVEQCQAIAERLQYLADQKRRFSIVIAGGGFEGVEALGEILRKYRHHTDIQIHVIEGQNRLMMDAPADIDSELRRLCAPYPVNWHIGKTVIRVREDSVELSDQTTLPSQITIWTGGTVPPNLLYESGLSDAQNQWMRVNAALQHPVFSNIFAAGDAAGMHQPLRKQAYHAMDMGKAAAENMIRHHADKPLKDFKPSAKPMLVSFGDMDAFLIDKRAVVAGPALGILKEAVFQLVMTELDPSGILTKAFHASGRVSAATMKLAATLSVSPSALAKLGKVRMLKPSDTNIIEKERQSDG